jgi:hypothetical protein
VPIEEEEEESRWVIRSLHIVMPQKTLFLITKLLKFKTKHTLSDIPDCDIPDCDIPDCESDDFSTYTEEMIVGSGGGWN